MWLFCFFFLGFFGVFFSILSDLTVSKKERIVSARFQRIFFFFPRHIVLIL